MLINNWSRHNDCLVHKREMEKSPAYIVVVGASAGGLNSVIELSAQLKVEMDIAVLIVLHLSHLSHPHIFSKHIKKNTSFTCAVAENGALIKAQHIYLAVSDKHLLVKDGRFILGDGTPENRWRPSIDALFRSAAIKHR